MQKHLDTIIVGVLVFLVMVIILAVRPGYTPVEVTDDAMALMAGQVDFDGEPIMDEDAEAVEDESDMAGDEAMTDEDASEDGDIADEGESDDGEDAEAIEDEDAGAEASDEDEADSEDSDS